MSFPTSINSQSTDSLTQQAAADGIDMERIDAAVSKVFEKHKKHFEEVFLSIPPSTKLGKALAYLGSNWVLAKNTTYDAKRREPSGMCKTLRPVVLNAMVEGRL